jgi:beta-galactosidase
MRKLLNPKLPALWHGGDYSPEQWTHEVVQEDMRLMRLAHCQVATMGMFAWSSYEPTEGHYEFGWLDDAIDQLEKADRWFMLATPSAAPPAWLSRKYPETLKTGPGRVRRLHGNRVNFSLGSPIYREKTREAAALLARRYGKHPRLLAWHLCNEYGGEDFGPESTAAFRLWLQRKFNGDLKALNHAYWAPFWSHNYSDWEEIDPPGEPYGETAMHGLTLDWRRFVSDQTLEFMLNEAAPLRELSPDVPITTNMMGTYDGLDYRKFAPHLDFISWDSYPPFKTPLQDTKTWTETSFKHNLMRSLKPDRPWLLMESTPSSGNWFDVMQLKRPELHRFEALHAVAHGSDGVMYFQWRQSRGGFEQYHGAVVSHGGGEGTRVFKEVAQVGAELEQLKGVVGTTIKTEVAVVFDWECRWAVEHAAGPVRKQKGYEATCIEFNRAIGQCGASADLIGMDDPLDAYKVVVAPMAYSLLPRFAERVERFVKGGGIFVTTYLSGWVDENCLVFAEGFLSPLERVLGLKSEEIDALYPYQSNRTVVASGNELGFEGEFESCDFCELVNPSTAEVLAIFGDDFYAGRPALTVNRYGAGLGVYVAARNESSFQDQLMWSLLKRAGVAREVEALLPAGVNIITREDGEMRQVFFLNATGEPVTISTRSFGKVELGPFDIKLEGSAVWA